MRRGWLLTARLVVILGLLAGLAARSAGAAEPRLRLRPDEGVPNASIVVRGRHFPAGAEGIIRWGTEPEPVATFAVDGNGEFELHLAVPNVPPGTYRVVAETPGRAADDTFVVLPVPTAERASASPPASITNATPQASPGRAPDACAMEPRRELAVGTSAELEQRLAEAQPGDRIRLADGVYTGNFVVDRSGTAEAPIALCGDREAIIDGGGWEHSGYALHIRADHVTVGGITVRNAQKGVMLDGAGGVVLDGIEVHTIGHEAVHFRTHSSGNVIQDSDIHDTGLDNEKFGEGIYIGSAVSNWERYTGGEPDRSDSNQVLNNRIWNTSSESVDIKEGTEGGLIEGNVFDGAGMTGADSWVDMKGNGYIIRGNVGMNSPKDGFQTHVIDDMGWGRENVFEGNVVVVNGDGYGFYIHEPERTANVVRCDNVVEAAGSGVSNLPEPCSER